MKIMIVEDSSFTRGLIKRDLDEDHEVLETGDGLGGLVKLVEEQPDLVLVDLLMPWVDGFEFLKRARETGFGGPILVCSANTQPAIESRVRELGGTAFIAKPELLIPGRARRLVEQYLGVPEPCDHDAGEAARLRGLLKDGMQAAADILARVTGRSVETDDLAIHGPPPAELREAESASIRVQMELDGGLTGCGHVLIPDGDIVAAASASQGPLPPPGATDMEVAAEIGNLLINAFAARFAEIVGREVDLSLPTCHLQDDAERQPVGNERVSVCTSLHVEGCEEPAEFMMVLDGRLLPWLKVRLESGVART